MSAVVEAAVPRAEAIARLNDKLRKEGTGGTIVITRGVAGIDGFDRQELLAALATFDGFDPDNDPHVERDFGDLTLWATDMLFKFDYYDPVLCFGSNDPADPAVTHRILTIMLPEEW